MTTWFSEPEPKSGGRLVVAWVKRCAGLVAEVDDVWIASDPNGETTEHPTETDACVYLASRCAARIGEDFENDR